MKRIISIWLPAWPIERLKRACPDMVPDNHAFALVSETARGLIITALNAAARREGLRPGTALADARAMLPALMSAPARTGQDRAALQRLARWCGRYGPARHVDGPASSSEAVGQTKYDGIWIDATGVAALFASHRQHGLRGLEKSLRSERGNGSVSRLANERSSPSPLMGEGWGGGEPAALAARQPASRQSPASALHPTPNPSPSRGGGSTTEAMPRLESKAAHHIVLEARLRHDERLLLDDLAGRLRGFALTPRIGLADTLGAAHALARFGGMGGEDFAIAAPGETRAAIADLPVEALRLEPPAVLLLKRLGLRRIGQLYGIGRPALERRFRDGAGRAGRGSKRATASMTQTVLLRLDQALGIIAEPRAPMLEPPRHSARLAFAEPLVSAEALHHVVGRLAADLGDMLEAAHCGARRLRLSLYRADASTAEVIIGTSFACRDADHFMRLLREKIGTIDAGFGIDALSFDALHVEPLQDLQTKFDGAGKPGAGKPGAGKPGAGHNYAALIDRLANRLGAPRLYALGARESHLPERAQIKWPPLAARSAETKTSGRPEPARPPLLLPAPEPITVMAEIPEGPPLRFTWRAMMRRVVKAEGPERIEAEWWRTPGQPSGRPRDYYHVEDEKGGRYWLFREGRFGRTGESRPPAWFMHGLFG